MATKHEINSLDSHIGNLDILRFTCALSIVIFHTNAMLASKGAINSVINYFQFGLRGGVDIFFVLSGFVISKSLARKKFTIIEFLKGRFFRIYPTYFFLTLFTFIVMDLLHYFRGSTTNFSLSQFLTSIFFVSGLSGIGSPIIQQGWTLEYEVGFYLIAAISMKFKKNRHLILLIILVMEILLNPNSILFCEFILGVLVYKFVDKINLSPFLASNILIISIILEFYIPHHTTGKMEILSVGLISASVLISVIGMQQVRNHKFRILGTASYHIYLVQSLIIIIFYKLLPATFNGSYLTHFSIVVAVVILSVVLGFIINRFIDARIRNLFA